MSKKIEFLISLGNLIRTGGVKTIKQAMDFAKQQFGKIDQSFVDDIINVFKKEGKTKKGDVVPIKKKEGINTLPESEKYDQSLLEQKAINFLKRNVKKEKEELEKVTELEKLSSELLKDAKSKKSKLNTTELDAKLDEIGKERAIRIRKQNEEVERRTGKPFKQGPSLEDDINLKGEIHPKTDEMSDQQREFLGFPNRTVEAIVRTAARDVLEKAGLGPRIKGQDPIDMARQIYGDEILDALDNISEELLEAPSYSEISRILSDKKIYNFKPRQGLNVRQKGEIEDITAFDPEGRDPNAYGGIIGNLRLNRTGYKIGGGIKLYNAGKSFWELLKNPKKIRAAIDDIFPTGDYKYDAEMAADALVENNPKTFKGLLREDLPDNIRSEIYGAVIGPIQQNALMVSRMKKATKPTKTLEGIENTGTINISDPEVAEEFARFMKETDPEGSKVIEQTVELSNFNPKGRKKNATGGLTSMLGE